MIPSPQDLTDALLSAARTAGAEAADALAVSGTALSIEVRQGALEHAERAESIEIGLRVLIGKRQACVSSSDVRADTIGEMAERAVAMAREAPEDPSIGLADPAQLGDAADISTLELADPADEPAPAALEADALAAEAAALSVDGVAQVSTAGADYSRSDIALDATNGLSMAYSRTTSRTSCVAISGEGTAMERDYCFEARTFRSDLPGADEIGRIAGDRAASMRGARKPPTGAYPVLYDERVSGSLIGHLVAAANGTAIARGASWLRDAMGDEVLPESLSLVEDPHRPRIGRSRPRDAEGLPTRKRALVQNGRLERWILDLSAARKLGLESTANAARATHAPPSPSASNLVLTQGTRSRDDLIAEMGTGLLVTSMIGASINPNTGDYSRGASGFWVENGEIAFPVNECTIAGNLRDMLRSLIPANDARMHLSVAVPSLLVEGLTIAGS